MSVEVRNGGEVALLTAGPGFRCFGHAIGERFVVRVCDELSALEEVAKMTNTKVECQQLAVESTILSLGGSQFTAEESERYPDIIYQLL